MASNGRKRQSNGATAGRADDVLVGALASGATRGEAAEAAGVGARTVYRRLSDPDFAARVQTARAKILDDVLTRTAELAGRAVDKLGQLLEADSPAVQLGAARVILTTAAEFGERAELAERVAALEAVLGQRKNGSGPT